MVQPMNPMEFHTFREIVASMSGDSEIERQDMIDALGKDISGDLASSIARLADRPLMNG